MPKTQQELYDDFITELQNLKPDLTDTNEGSIIDILAGVTSSAVDEVSKLTLEEFKKTYFDTAEGVDLENLAVDHFGSTFARPGATKSTGVVTFSRATTAAGNVTIPVGTIVKTTSSATGSAQRFEVTAAVILTSTSINASVRAMVAGVNGNVQAAAVNVVESTLTDTTVTVSNASSFTGGAETQDDSTYRETIRNLLNALTGSTSSAIESKALTIAGVESANCVESKVFVKEWNISGNTSVGRYFSIVRAILYIADANGTASATLISDVRSAIESIRAVGVYIDVIGAVAISIDWTATIVLNPAGPNYATLQTSSQMIKDEMTKYVQDLPIGTSFSRSSANAYILAKFGPAGTNDLTSFTTSSPVGDIFVASNQKPVPGSIGTS